MRSEKNLEVLKNLKTGCFNPALLRQYSGWGGLRDDIYTPKIYSEIKKILTPEEIVNIKKTMSSAYYTPPEIVRFIYQWLIQYGFIGGSILEPAVGHGVFIEHLPKEIYSKSEITAVEIDLLTSQIVKILYPQIKLHICAFENFNYEKCYDLIVGNPPYGANTVFDAKHADLKGFCIHHYFVAKSMRLLKENGILAMVLPSYFMDNISKHVRYIIQKEGGHLITAYRLPDNLFENAKITIDIVFLRKSHTGVAWTNTKRINIDNMSLPINEFFYDNRNHILGRLAVVDMYQRKGLTCLSKGKDIETLLKDQLVKPAYKINLKQYIQKIEQSISSLQMLKQSLLEW